jgi:hypothetical protein
MPLRIGDKYAQGALTSRQVVIVVPADIIGLETVG